MPKAMLKGAEIYYEESGSGPPILLTAGGFPGVLAGHGRWLESCPGNAASISWTKASRFRSSRGITKKTAR